MKPYFILWAVPETLHLDGVHYFDPNAPIPPYHLGIQDWLIIALVLVICSIAGHYVRRIDDLEKRVTELEKHEI